MARDASRQRAAQGVAAAVAVIALTMLSSVVLGGASDRLLAFVVPVGRAPVAAPTAPTATEEGTLPAAKESLSSADLARDAGAAVPPRERGERPYNVVLVTIDTLRFDLGFAGYPRPVTPHLDALAARSTVFERAYALASYTPKSVGPMLIGRYATETYRDRAHYTTFYGANTFLAERVRAAGGRTTGAASHLYFAMKFGIDQGFDVWDTSAMPPGMTDNDARVTSDKLSDVAMAQLARSAGAAPFFAWFHYVDPHAPYVAHEGAPSFTDMPSPGGGARDLYDQEVWFTDRQVGRVLDFIAAQPWAEDTAIIVTADHGEAFGEKGHWKHGREVWESLVRVPLVVFVPGAEPMRVPVKRSHIDLAPTVLDLMGIPSKEGELRGKSLLADVLASDGTELEERDVLVDMPDGPFNEARRAIITGPSPGMKLVQLGPRYELYDLEADPDEARSLPLEGPRFQQVRDAFKQRFGALKEIAPSTW